MTQPAEPLLPAIETTRFTAEQWKVSENGGEAPLRRRGGAARLTREVRMRVPTSVPLVAVLGVALAGCDGLSPKAPDRPAKPVVATVVLRVPGMT